MTRTRETEREQDMAKGFLKGVLWGTGISLATLTVGFAIDGASTDGGASGSRSSLGPALERAGNRADTGSFVSVIPKDVLAPDTLSALVDETFSTAAVPVTGAATDLAETQVPEASALNGISAPATSAPSVSYTGTATLDTPATEPKLSISTDPAQPAVPEPTPQATAFADPEDTENSLPALTATLPDEPAQPQAPGVSAESSGFAPPSAQEPSPAPSEITALAPAASPEAAAIAPALSDVSDAAPLQPSQAPVNAGASLLDTVPVAEADAPETAVVTASLTDPAGIPQSPQTEQSTTAPVAAEQIVDAPDTAQQPEGGVEIDAQIAPAPDNQTASVALPEPQTLDTSALNIVQSTNAPEPRVSEQVPAGDARVKVNRLPTLGQNAPEEAVVGAEPEDPAPEAFTITAPSETPPVARYAARFDNPENKPIMSVVLIDDGTEAPGAVVDLAALRDLPYPVSLAFDALQPDAAARMATYRDAGFEVLAMVDLPQGATAKDAEVNLGVALDAMPEAVGVIEGVSTGVHTTPDAGRQVAQILAQTGHGFVTQNRGLNTVQKLAARAGVPSGVVFRDFDAKGQNAAVIRRFLDQAAFRARQEGQVIMLGRLREETVAAIVVWALEDRARTVAVGPVSAALAVQ